MAFLDDRNEKTPTKKQVDARERNWYIRKLRAYFHLCPIRNVRGEKIQKLIDLEITSLEAESEIKREEQRANYSP
jgi:hypothetical protein